MAIEFRGARFPPLCNLTVSAPSGAVIGVIGEKGAGEIALLRLAAGIEKPLAGEVICEGIRRYLGPSDAVDLSPVDMLVMEHSLAQQDALARGQALVGIDRLRSDGTTVLIASHEADLLRRLCDEVWWLDAGALRGRGDPGEVLDAYQELITEKFRAWGETQPSPVRRLLQRGDGRAEIISLDTLGETGQPTMIWRCGEQVSVRVLVRYLGPVQEPVIGILIRTRIGLAVYGTNTELENIKTGSYVAGDRMQAVFRFRCDLCPGEYTLTAASHDPDGTAHDWIDNALAFVVTDSRYTAGVANLRARIEVEKTEVEQL
ncbi:MAG TPA: Wzt carbohydrate-binding domain-containing protein [Bryobacteraceae bacterium]|nr:Wzt carbohydrate-binding domain-containing protein [Bryobacteraceae bacterium]